MRKKRILIVDDEPEFTATLRLNLERFGNFEVKEENDATHGLETAKGFRPDLVLLDIVMPKMEGSELAHLLQSDEDLKSVPIIFLTATVVREEVEEHGGVIGTYPFIAKPAMASEIMDCIERVLGTGDTP
ncbi:MAG: response regulator [Candidatus Omnitrophica bacterium]|nr:response regulator [Candidatus Omnitrophota bacterium]